MNNTNNKLSIDRSNNDILNLNVLKRKDPFITEIIETASHSVVYEFIQSKHEWIRVDIEGCLFIVKRIEVPTQVEYQLIVHNRLNTTNMVLQLTSKIQMEVIDKFLLLRYPVHETTISDKNDDFIIYGIWFFPEVDREKIEKVITRIVNSDNTKDTNTNDFSKKMKEEMFIKTNNSSSDTIYNKSNIANYNINDETYLEHPKLDGKAAGQEILGMFLNNTNNKKYRQKKDDETIHTNLLKRDEFVEDTFTEKQRINRTTSWSQASNSHRYFSSVETPKSIRRPLMTPAKILLGSKRSIPITSDKIANLSSIDSTSSMLLTPDTLSRNVSSARSSFSQVDIVKDNNISSLFQKPLNNRSRNNSETTKEFFTNENLSVINKSKECFKQTFIELLNDPVFFEQIYSAYINKLNKYQ